MQVHFFCKVNFEYVFDWLFCVGTDNAVSLAAHTALGHLVNHLGHFPLARGTSVLTSVVSEHHDGPDPADKLSPSLFSSPEVQV